MKSQNPAASSVYRLPQWSRYVCTSTGISRITTPTTVRIAWAAALLALSS